MTKINDLEKILADSQKSIEKMEQEANNLSQEYENYASKAQEELGKQIFEKYVGKNENLEKLEELESKITARSEEVVKDGYYVKGVPEKRRALRSAVQEDIFKKVAKATDEEKMAIGTYMAHKNLISTCNGFGYYKNPTSCGGCQSGERLLDGLNLKKYAKFEGDRVYKIPKEVKEEAINALMEKTNIMKDAKKDAKEKQVQSKEIMKTVESEKKKCEEIAKKLQVYGVFSKSDVKDEDIETIEEKMPSFIKAMKKKNVTFATADLKNNVGVMLIDESHYYGSGGCEYGVTVKVMRDGDSEQEYFKWRDAYSSGNDNKSLYFNKAKIVKITDKSVTLELKSNTSSKTETFELAKSKSKNLTGILNEHEQEKWQTEYDQTKKNLLKQHYMSNATQADYIGTNYLTHGVPTTGKQVPYDQSQIVDEQVDSEKGLAAIVIKSQIDAAADSGKQYAWTGYLIDKNGKARQVYSDNASQMDLKDGKRIEVKASDLLKEKKK